MAIRFGEHYLKCHEVPASDRARESLAHSRPTLEGEAKRDDVPVKEAANMIVSKARCGATSGRTGKWSRKKRLIRHPRTSQTTKNKVGGLTSGLMLQQCLVRGFDCVGRDGKRLGNLLFSTRFPGDDDS